MTTPITLSRTSNGRPLPRAEFILSVLALACFALCPVAQAVTPPPDGGYAGGNTAEGQSALLSLTSGTYNTAVGLLALESNTTGKFNTATGAGALLVNTADSTTATGAGALFSNTAGSANTADGAFALFSNTTGSANTAVGLNALFSNTTGHDNTANGLSALFNNIGGNDNTANGVTALFFNTTGNDNTANGFSALGFNNTGFENTAVGSEALASNNVGHDNTATGTFALANNSTGNFNNAFGRNALANNTDGGGNVAVGDTSLFNHTTGDNNVAVGNGALVNNATGGGNIAVGFFAGVNTDGSNNIDIGNGGSGGESGVIRIGDDNNQFDTFIAGIFNRLSISGATVLVNSDGKLGTTTSSRRFKENIKPMERASEAIYALKPVTFRYKKDPTGLSQFGLVAEDVEQVNPDLVVRDKEGKPYTVRYEQINAMLLNEFLKEHKMVEKQQANITELKSTVAKQGTVIAQQQESFQAKLGEQQKQIEALTSGLQKVNAEIEVSKNPSQIAGSNP